ncbi:hypothetical protein AB0J82_36070 [Asanoa sp. NPDC049518]|uniref:hypothetical protein n=1 Tax=unclassified Asanoa TaxID=2685164 RepID=UPI003442B02F
MAGQGGSRWTPFGLGVAVALGWYVTVVAAVFVGSSGIPAAPDRDCNVIFSCMAPHEELILILIVGAPVLAGLLVCTLVVAGLLARVSRSSILIGTLSALGSLAVVGMVALVWQGAR